MTIENIPLPDMPDLPTLWAVHVLGPDDIIAAVDKAEAEKHAAGINGWYEARSKEPDFDPKTFPTVRAEVVEYPYSRESHAESVARGDGRWAVGGVMPAPRCEVGGGFRLGENAEATFHQPCPRPATHRYRVKGFPVDQWLNRCQEHTDELPPRSVVVEPLEVTR